MKHSLLLRAYYELLYELVESNRDALVGRAGDLLVEEVEIRGFGDFDSETYEAYSDACTAFIDERIESYNPVGIQYTFARVGAKEVAELEMQLDWYDSRAEFEALVRNAREIAERGIADDALASTARELIRECGAFPGGSIICTYERKPAVNRLPDYIVARSIEDLVGRE